ncbi:hypothetical protein BYT27DRAFT_7253169 [Phlegmacium glaucopus]|nr:hypothetical protein BYT27DRAFT_7253169 [Phlegmacium glaucopus]
MSGQRGTLTLKFIVVGGGNSDPLTSYQSRSMWSTFIMEIHALQPLIPFRKRVTTFFSLRVVTTSGHFQPALRCCVVQRCASFNTTNMLNQWGLGPILKSSTEESYVFYYSMVNYIVDPDSASGYVGPQTGERLCAEIIVGADRYENILRPLVTEFDDFQNLLILNVPVDLLRLDKYLNAGLIGLVTDTSFIQLLW